jgi:hypothetical protein
MDNLYTIYDLGNSTGFSVKRNIERVIKFEMRKQGYREGKNLL